MTDAEALAAIEAAMERVARRNRRRARLLLLASTLVCAASVAITYIDLADLAQCGDGSTYAVLDLHTEALYCITTETPPVTDPEEDPADA